MSDLATQNAIAQLVPKGARVLDLGCGDGAMLAHIQVTRGCSGYGIEIDDANVLACVQPQVVAHADLAQTHNDNAQTHVSPLRWTAWLMAIHWGLARSNVTASKQLNKGFVSKCSMTRLSNS